MTNTESAVDTKYLFKRNETWWVKVAVPRSLRKLLGYDLRKSLHTHDLEQAREARWAVAEELRARIEKAHEDKDSKSANQDSKMVDIEVASREKTAGAQQVNEYIVEIVSDSGEGRTKMRPDSGTGKRQDGQRCLDRRNHSGRISSRPRENARAPAVSGSVWVRKK